MLVHFGYFLIHFYLMQQMNLTLNNRLVPTFAGVLREKIRTCAGFNKIPTNYISEKSLTNGVYDKSIV